MQLLTGPQASQTHREHRELGTGGMGALVHPSLPQKSTRMGLEEEEGILTRDQRMPATKVPLEAPTTTILSPEAAHKGGLKQEAATWDLATLGSHPRSGVCRLCPWTGPIPL